MSFKKYLPAYNKPEERSKYSMNSYTSSHSYTNTNAIKFSTYIALSIDQALLL